MTIKCDVLVVGGGPAGCSAARSAAMRGLKTLLIENHHEIGIPVQCAEGIGSYLFPLLPFKIPRSQLIWKIDGMFFSDGETDIINKGPTYKAWSVDREKFDKWLFLKAKNAGTNVMMNTELVDIVVTKDYDIKNVTVQKDSRSSTIKPSFIIAADGVESTVARILGLLKKSEGSIGNVFSWEMKNLSMNKPHLEQIYFGDFAPRAYAYVFPKSKHTANVGVGSTKGEKNLEEHFDFFINEIISMQTKNAVKTIDRSGKAPIKYIVPKWKYGNILFTGDAANQNFKPFVEGILPSIICGDIAGNVVKKNNVIDYERMIKRKLGNQFKKSDEILDKIFEVDKVTGNKKDLLSMYLYAFMQTEIIDDLINQNIDAIKKELLRKSSSINSFITMLQYFIWYFKVLATRRD